MITIIHFTTVHRRDDSRIRSKMVAALHRHNPGRVKLFVQDGLGNEIDPEGFCVVDTGPHMSRLFRMTLGAWRMMWAVASARPTIAHFHDPELLPWSIFLRLLGIVVIYDVHEDYPKAVKHNFRLPWIARTLLPLLVRIVEWVGARLLNGVITVTPTISARFPDKKTVMVRNFPMISEFQAPNAPPIRDRPLEVAYIGTITLNRNILGMIDAIELARHDGVVLNLAGDFPVASDEATTRAHPGWENVKFNGWVSREGIASILASARCGLLVLHPLLRFKQAYPIKLFEYMAAGIPVISSDFPLWREIVEDAGCGLLVNPLDTQAIADAIQWMFDNPEKAQSMGERGRRAVIEKYNWDNEVKNLIRFYNRFNIIRDHSVKTRN